MSWTWLGLAVLVLLAFSMVDGYQKGFVKEVVSAFLVLISVVMVWLINPYVNQFIRENTAVYEKIQTSSESFVSSLVDGRGIMDEEGQNELISSMNLPELLQKGIAENNTASVYQQLAANTFAEYISGYLANVAVNCLSFLVSYILSSILIHVLAYALDLLTKLDFIFARAQLSRSMNGTQPDFNEEGRILIKKGRHPLLDKKKVVPIDIQLGKDFELLIITGPNTGGKTVSLKTVGLFTLMGQAGLHIPAFDHSELSVFHEVFADIGDEQSIEQSLSTFSAHMTNTVSILKEADDRSLVLFDELGAGTDPTEGAALAIAILSNLHRRGSRVMATTHYSELKVFALSTPGVENGCCEFDVETLRPTYRLLIGVPGKSNAFAISQKLGLSQDIIEEAKTHLTKQDEDFEDLLADLEQKRVTIEQERDQINSYKEEIRELKQRLESKQEKLDLSRDKILREANEQARNILQEAKDYADTTIRNFQKYGKAAGVSAKDMEKERGKLREKMSTVDKKLSAKNAAPKKSHKQLTAKDLHIGDSIKVLSLNLKGTVSTLPDAKGNLFVQMGILRSQVNIRDLEKLDDTVITGGNFSKTGSGKIKMSKSASVSTEINLLGKTVDEAIMELDKYLDDAYIAHLPSVRIVHGKGTGALRKGVHNYLRRQKHVKSYRLGEFGEGDAGVTIVEFK